MLLAPRLYLLFHLLYQCQYAIQNRALLCSNSRTHFHFPMTIQFHFITGHVIGIDVSCSQLQGTIHSNSSLFSLQHLQRLNLSYNDFSGSKLSPKFGWFVNMTHLNLTTCNFTGEVPYEISYLSKLVSLDLSRNGNMKLEDSSLQRLIRNQTKLSELFFTQVDMSLVSPNSFMNLSSSLTSLCLYDCQLKGRFPYNIFHLPNLHFLDLRYNHNLTGSIPKYNWSSPLKSKKMAVEELDRRISGCQE
ncbi:hypothetical protein CMV_008819 [Castanea mollissima]|uniref:Non-specific serine/threonine protein kinase n=1 Tax=Castanea mollissima TaxID=60419 RepID=A0A8J4RQD6_9ROSI|nr:hypothetical protein CMV_008819 [Castanea mollissima]